MDWIGSDNGLLCPLPYIFVGLGADNGWIWLWMLIISDYRFGPKVGQTRTRSVQRLSDKYSQQDIFSPLQTIYRTIERERDWRNWWMYYWASGASIYRRTGSILECKTRHEESYLYPNYRTCTYLNISLTPPRSRSGSVVNNINDVDGQTGDKQK
jgi:hypothetical protein